MFPKNHFNAKNGLIKRNYISNDDKIIMYKDISYPIMFVNSVQKDYSVDFVLLGCTVDFVLLDCIVGSVL